MYRQIFVIREQTKSPIIHINWKLLKYTIKNWENAIALSCNYTVYIKMNIYKQNNWNKIIVYFSVFNYIVYFFPNNPGLILSYISITTVYFYYTIQPQNYTIFCFIIFSLFQKYSLPEKYVESWLAESNKSKETNIHTEQSILK